MSQVSPEEITLSSTSVPRSHDATAVAESTAVTTDTRLRLFMGSSPLRARRIVCPGANRADGSHSPARDATSAIGSRDVRRRWYAARMRLTAMVGSLLLTVSCGRGAGG